MKNGKPSCLGHFKSLETNRYSNHPDWGFRYIYTAAWLYTEKLWERRTQSGRFTKRKWILRPQFGNVCLLQNRWRIIELWFSTYKWSVPNTVKLFRPLSGLLLWKRNIRANTKRTQLSPNLKCCRSAKTCVVSKNFFFNFKPQLWSK